jgi:hypothetical protein
MTLFKFHIHILAFKWKIPILFYIELHNDFIPFYRYFQLKIFVLQRTFAVLTPNTA